MYCKECGKQIDDDSKFCSFCGTRQQVMPSSKTSDLGTELYSIADAFKKSINISNEKSVEKKLRYDSTYKNSAPLIIGVILFVTMIVIFIVLKFDGHQMESGGFARGLLQCLFLIQRFQKQQ